MHGTYPKYGRTVVWYPSSRLLNVSVKDASMARSINHSQRYNTADFQTPALQNPRAPSQPPHVLPVHPPTCSQFTHPHSARSEAPHRPQMQICKKSRGHQSIIAPGHATHLLGLQQMPVAARVCPSHNTACHGWPVRCSSDQPVTYIHTYTQWILNTRAQRTYLDTHSIPTRIHCHRYFHVSCMCQHRSPPAIEQWEVHRR